MTKILLSLFVIAIHAALIDGAPRMCKKVIGGDGSCLFSSFQYAIKRGKMEEGVNHRLRTLVKNEIDKYPDLYTEEMLGAPVETYKANILHHTTWGGGIELSIFSNYYKTEIGVCNVEDGKMIMVGDIKDNNEIDTIVFLVYNSARDHYDVMYRDDYPSDGEFETIFRVTDDDSREAAKQFCKSLSGRGGSSSSSKNAFSGSYAGSGMDHNYWYMGSPFYNWQ